MAEDKHFASPDMNIIVEPLKRQLAYFEGMSVQLVQQVKAQSEEIRMLRAELEECRRSPPPHPTQQSPRTNSPPVGVGKAPSSDETASEGLAELPEDVKKLVDSIVRRRVRQYTTRMEAAMSITLREYLSGITDSVIDGVVERRLRSYGHLPSAPQAPPRFPPIGNEITALLNELREEHPDVFIPRS